MRVLRPALPRPRRCWPPRCWPAAPTTSAARRRPTRARSRVDLRRHGVRALGDRGRPPGNLAFEVTNTGTQVTEFYLLAEDGLRIVGEVENIGPGLTRDLVVTAPAGTYVTACKPGMIGDGIRGRLHRHRLRRDAGAERRRHGARRRRRTRNYAAYVKDQSAQLLARDRGVRRRSTRPATTTRRARSTPSRARTGSGSRPSRSRSVTSTRRWTPREADLEPGQQWTGWHRIEKDLWPRAPRTTRR